MEGNNIKPMNLERVDSLKVFGMVSVSKEVPIENIKDKLSLTIAVTYTPAEAIISAGQALEKLGKNPANYNLGFMQLSIRAEEFIRAFNLPVTTPLDPIKNDSKKSIEEIMVDNTRMIFNLVGTTTQKRSVEKVIQKFNKYVSDKSKRIIGSNGSNGRVTNN